MARTTLAAFLAFTSMTACATTGGGSAVSAGAPEWVERGNSLVIADDHRYFAGVGQARDRLRLPLLKKVAEKKALEGVREPLKQYLAVLAKPWLGSLDKKVMQEKPRPQPLIMLDKLLDRCVGLAAVQESWEEGNKAAWALAAVDLTAVLLEMQASADVQPMITFLMQQNVDPKVVFEQLSRGPSAAPETNDGGDAPAEGESGGDKEAEDAEAGPANGSSSDVGAGE